jgi:hypothetical protein
MALSEPPQLAGVVLVKVQQYWNSLRLCPQALATQLHFQQLVLAAHTPTASSLPQAPGLHPLPPALLEGASRREDLHRICPWPELHDQQLHPLIPLCSHGSVYRVACMHLNMNQPDHAES